MRKRILSILLVGILVGSLTACGGGEKNSSSKEYDIEEFGKLLDETDELFEKESEYLTSEEMYGEEAYELYKECSKETGLPFNKKVTIRGKKQASTIGFNLVSSDEKYNVPCFFGSGDYEDKTDKNVSMFIEDGENVIVTGIISEKENSYGCLTNIAFESPKEIEGTYKNNIEEVLGDEATGCKVVFGEIELIQSIDEFKNAVEALKNTNYEHQDFYFDSVATISSTSDESNGTVSFAYDSDIYDLKEGDKIATQGFIDDLMKDYYDTNITWGFMGNVYDIYKFE